jgi:hypothetical protein
MTCYDFFTHFLAVVYVVFAFQRNYFNMLNNNQTLKEEVNAEGQNKAEGVRGWERLEKE